MSLKSISPTLPPQVGSGFFSHTPREWRRNARIHSGSLFMREIISTISRSSPFRDLNAYASSGSWNPYLYWSRSMPSGLVTAMMPAPPRESRPDRRPDAARRWELVPDPKDLPRAPDLALRGDLGGHLLVLRPDAIVPDLIELVGKRRAARGHDPAVEHDVNRGGLDVLQDPRVMGDDERPHLLPGGLVHPVHPGRHDLDRVHVQPRVGLVHDRDLRLEHRHLQDLGTLLLPAAEPLVHVAAEDRRIDLQLRHLRPDQLLKLGQAHQTVLVKSPPRAHRGAQEAGHRHPGNAHRVLKRDEQTPAGPLVGRHRHAVLAFVEHLALGHLVKRIAHQHVGERALPRPVGAHQGVDLSRAHGQVGPFEDHLILDLRPQILDHELGVHPSPPTAPRPRGGAWPQRLRQFWSELLIYYSMVGPGQCQHTACESPAAGRGPSRRARNISRARLRFVPAARGAAEGRWRCLLPHPISCAASPNGASTTWSNRGRPACPSIPPTDRATSTSCTAGTETATFHGGTDRGPAHPASS